MASQNKGNGTDEKFEIPNYKILKRIGEGGFGVVYLAEEVNDLRLRRAIKVHIPIQGQKTDNLHERFYRETEALSKLSHQYICGYIYSGITSGNEQWPYIVMDYIEGDDLLKVSRQMTVEQRIEVFLQVLEGLNHAHSLKILHRDIKPSNIMIRKHNNQAVIVDFGLSYIYDGISKETITKSLLGSLGYIPPEVECDPRTRTFGHDIFSSGVTLYQLIADRKPNIQKYQSLSMIDPYFINLDPIVKKSIAHIDERYKTIIELMKDLRSWEKSYSVLVNLPNNTSDFADKVFKKKQKQDMEQESIRNKQEKVAMFASEHHLNIYITSKKIFSDTISIVKNIWDEYDFEIIQDSSDILKSSPWQPIMRIHNENSSSDLKHRFEFWVIHFQLDLHFSKWRKPLDLFRWTDYAYKHDRNNSNPASAPRKFLEHAWVFIESYSSKSPNLRGAFIASEEFQNGQLTSNLYSRPIEFPADHFLPIHMKGVNEIHRYIKSITERCFVDP